MHARSILSPLGLCCGLVCGLLGLASCGTAQTPSATTAPEIGRHALWQVTAADTGEELGTAYLLGSIHLGRAEGASLPEVVETAFAEADVVVFEVDLDEIYADPLGILELAFFQDQRTLQSELSEKAWALVVERMNDVNFLLTFAKAKPWFLALTLSIGELQSEGYSAQAGLDHVLFQRAKEAGKERIALETGAEQLAFFDSFSREEQEMFLLQTLEETGDTTDAADELVELWEKGDTEGLAGMFAEEKEQFPALFDKLLEERNRSWLPRIEELLREHRTVLVVVGAAHLVGDGSLVELLREAGYRVRQM